MAWPGWMGGDGLIRLGSWCCLSVCQSLRFSKSLLSVWDNSMATATDVQTRQLSIGQDILLMMENKVSLLARARTRGQVAVLYARRGLSLITYMAIQLAGAVYPPSPT